MIRYAPIVGILALIALAPPIAVPKAQATQSPATTLKVQRSTYVCPNGKPSWKNINICINWCQANGNYRGCLEDCMCSQAR